MQNQNLSLSKNKPARVHTILVRCAFVFTMLAVAFFASLTPSLASSSHMQQTTALAHIGYVSPNSDCANRTPDFSAYSPSIICLDPAY